MFLLIGPWCVWKKVDIHLLSGLWWAQKVVASKWTAGDKVPADERHQAEPKATKMSFSCHSFCRQLTSNEPTMERPLNEWTRHTHQQLVSKMELSIDALSSSEWMNMLTGPSLNYQKLFDKKFTAYLMLGSLGDGSLELQVELLSERDGLLALELLLLRFLQRPPIFFFWVCQICNFFFGHWKKK